MCASLSAYVHACAAEGVLLNGWRNSACSKSNLNYQSWNNEVYIYHIQTLSESFPFQKGSTWLPARRLWFMATKWQAVDAPAVLSVSQTWHVGLALPPLMAAAVLKELT